MSPTRREFCKGLAALPLLAASTRLFAANGNFYKTTSQEDSMTFTLPPLPYAQDALAPYISANTLSFHYGKHHQAYVDNLNKLVKDTPLEKATLEQVIEESSKDPAKQGIFNNAAQVWNHTFYWYCMKPNGGGKPSAGIAQKIESDLGGFDQFKEQFKQACTTQFGSGWGWLVLDGGKLKIVKTANADLPAVHGQKPLLTCDVWEHAYYLDYQNRRPDYVTTFLDHLVNWEFVEKSLG